jgi:putative transposase
VTLGEIGHRLGRKALGDVATAALPDTILGRTESSSPANSMDRAHVEPRAGRRSAKKSRKLIIRMAKENRSCGYDRIVGALANLGHQVSDQTVGNVPLFPQVAETRCDNAVDCRERLGGLLRYCHRDAA